MEAEGGDARVARARAAEAAQARAQGSAQGVAGGKPSGGGGAARWSGGMDASGGATSTATPVAHGATAFTALAPLPYHIPPARYVPAVDAPWHYHPCVGMLPGQTLAKDAFGNERPD